MKEKIIKGIIITTILGATGVGGKLMVDAIDQSFKPRIETSQGYVPPLPDEGKEWERVVDWKRKYTK
jgi:hypothetical protein